MRDEILNLLNMEDVILHYNIKKRKTMCNCPFHKDKNPSMKIYEKSFYCFSCNRGGDFIQFVQYLFQLDFKQAMKKINYDFGLNLSKSLNKEELRKIQLEYEKEKERKKQLKAFYIKNMIEATNHYRIYSNLIKKFEKQMNEDNWEELQEAVLFLEEKLELLDEYMVKIESRV